MRGKIESYFIFLLTNLLGVFVRVLCVKISQDWFDSANL